MAALEMRSFLIDGLQLGLFCPTGPLGDHRKALPEAPLRCYLVGFLFATESDEVHRLDPTMKNELDQAAEPAHAHGDDASEMLPASNCAANRVANSKRMKATEQRSGLEFADG